MGIGKNINDQLEEKGITVAQLSRVTGIAATTIYSIIQRDSDSVSVNTLQKIAEALDVEIWELMGINREKACQNASEFEELGVFLADDDEYTEYELKKKALLQEEKEMVDNYYNTMVPVLKILGYQSNYFSYNNENSILLKKDGKEWEIPYKDVKHSITDSLFLADRLMNRHFIKVRKVTKDRQEALHNSPTKQTDTYKAPE